MAVRWGRSCCPVAGSDGSADVLLWLWGRILTLGSLRASLLPAGGQERRRSRVSVFAVFSISL